MRIITLTTDFGTYDWFVGTMKGVIAAIAPQARVIDLTHGILAGDLHSGAFALAASYRFFPKGTVHVAVVDPGVGSSRKAIAVQTASYVFIGPDNGLISWALRTEQVRAIHSVENDAYFLKPLSRTFHGRDLFAPVAAHLSRGVPLKKLGPSLEDFVRLEWPEPRPIRNGLQGEICYLDHFGNAITNLDRVTLGLLRGGPLQLHLTGKRCCSVADCYQSVRPGQLVAVLGSSGFLEIAINGGSAARQLRLRVGQTVVVRPR